MNTDRDKYLTEAMGECWHEDNGMELAAYTSCLNCGVVLRVNDDGLLLEIKRNTDFSTWQGFGKLWEWAKSHGARWAMAGELQCGRSSVNGGKFLSLPEELINPDRFANAVFEFLKGRE